MGAAAEGVGQLESRFVEIGRQVDIVATPQSGDLAQPTVHRVDQIPAGVRIDADCARRRLVGVRAGRGGMPGERDAGVVVIRA